MKKVLSIILAIAIIALLVGCSKNDNINMSKHNAKTSNKQQSVTQATEKSTKAPKPKLSKVTVIGEISNSELALEEWNGADILGNRSSLIPCEWNITYDKKNNILSKNCLSKDGKTSCDICYTYDNDNNVLSEIRKTNGKTIYEIKNTYYENGDIKSKKQKVKSGRNSKTTYDKYGNILSNKITDENGKKSSDEYKYAYDDNGNIIKCTNISKNKYYGSGKTTTTSNYTYDKNGNKLTLKEEIDNGFNVKSVLTKWEYDKKGKLIHYTSNNDEIKESTYTYDTNGNKISETNVYALDDKVRTKTWEYNTKGKVTSVKSDGVEEASYTYDKSGNLILFKQKSTTTSYKYFSNGNVKNKTVESNNSKQSWSYDKNENLIKYYAEYWQYEKEEYKVIFEYESV